MLRLPNLNFKIPRLRYDRVGWVLFILAMIWLLMSVISRKKEASTSELKVEIEPLGDGNKLINEKDVQNAIFKAFGGNIKGTTVSEIETARIESTLESDPFVKNADAYINVKNEISVRIEQREPILRILDSDGGNYYIDINGAKMPASKNYTARVLVATGNIGTYSSDFLDKKRNTIKDLYKLTITLNKDPFLKDFIQQIHVSKEGDITLIPLIGDQKIVLGSVARLDEKLEHLKTFYKKAMPYTGWRKYKEINLKYRNQIVCKK